MLRKKALKTFKMNLKRLIHESILSWTLFQEERVAKSMLLEIFLAACTYDDTRSVKMNCHRQNSVWIKIESVEKFYPDLGNHYAEDTCFVHHKDGHRTLMSENCASFKNRFENAR